MIVEVVLVCFMIGVSMVAAAHIRNESVRRGGV